MLLFINSFFFLSPSISGFPLSHLFSDWRVNIQKEKAHLNFHVNACFSHMLLMYVAAFTHVPTRDERVRLSFKSFRLTQTESTKSFFFFGPKLSILFRALGKFEVWKRISNLGLFWHVLVSTADTNFFSRLRQYRFVAFFRSFWNRNFN
jgi:hypothetical protein